MKFTNNCPLSAWTGHIYWFFFLPLTIHHSIPCLNGCSAASLLCVCVGKLSTPESTKLANANVFCWFGWIWHSMSMHPVASSSILTVLTCRSNVFFNRCERGFFSEKDVFLFNLYSLLAALCPKTQALAKATKGYFGYFKGYFGYFKGFYH